MTKCFHHAPLIWLFSVSVWLDVTIFLCTLYPWLLVRCHWNCLRMITTMPTCASCVLLCLNEFWCIFKIVIIFYLKTTLVACEEQRRAFLNILMFKFIKIFWNVHGYYKEKEAWNFGLLEVMDTRDTWCWDY